MNKHESLVFASLKCLSLFTSFLCRYILNLDSIILEILIVDLFIFIVVYFLNYKIQIVLFKPDI